MKMTKTMRNFGKGASPDLCVPEKAPSVFDWHQDNAAHAFLPVRNA
jgi:hypothetical protein